MKDNIELQLTEFEENNMSDIKKGMLIDDLKGLSEIQQGEIKLEHVFLFPKDSGVELGCFIRNTTSAQVFFGDVCIKIRNKKNGGKITEGKFNLNEKFHGVGSNKAVYFDLFFPLKDGIQFKDEDVELVWSDQLDKGEIKDIEFPFIDQLDDERVMVEEFIEKLVPMGEDEIKVDCFSMRRGGPETVELLILVRNSFERAVSLKKIDIKVIEEGDLVAGGQFETGFIKVDACEGKLYSFPLRKDHIFKEDINFEKCEVIIK